MTPAPTPDGSIERIERYLARLRRRWGLVSAAEAACGALVVLLATTAVALALASALGVGTGRWAWTVLGVGAGLAGALAWRLYGRPLRVRRTDERLALWVEGRVADLHSGVVTSVQTASHLRAGAAADPGLGFSPALARAAAHRTARTLSRTPAESLVSTARLRRLGLASAGAVAAWALLALTAPELVADGWRALSGGPALAAARDDGRVVDVAVGDLGFRLNYPPYLNLQPRTLERATGDLSAVAGTEVQFTGVTLFPAREVVLVLESDPEARWPLELSSDGVVRGAMRVGAPDRYQFVLSDARGRIVRERTWRTIDARPDATPEVRLMLPESDLEVHAGDEIPMVYEASDDYGLDRVDLAFAVEGGEPQRRAIKHPKGERSSRGSENLSVATLGLEPGQSADVWFEAVDQNSVTGPGVGASVKRRVTLYSPEAEHEALLTALDQLIQQMIDVLAERLESPVEAKNPLQLGTYLSVQGAIADASDAMMRRFERVIAAASTDPLAGDPLREGLRKGYDRLDEVHGQERAQLTKAAARDFGGPRPEVTVSLLAGVNDEVAVELETTILALKALLDRGRQDKILDKGRELLEAQNDLMKLLEELRDKGGDELAAAANEKLDQLERSLKKMEQEMAKLADRVPYDNQNASQRSGDVEGDMQSIQSQLDQVRQLIKEGRIEEALKMMEAMNRASQEMMASLQDGFGGGQRMSAQAQQAMNQLQNQLGQVRDGQQGVHDETSELEQRAREQQTEQLKEAMQGLREQARQVEERIGGADGEPLHPADRKALEQLKQAAGELGERLEAGDPRGALEAAKRLSQGAPALGEEIGHGEQREMDVDRAEAMRDAAQRLGQGGRTAGEIAGQLEKMQPQPGQGASPREAQEMQRLGKRQGQLEQQLGEAGKMLEQLDEGQLPGVRERLQQMLDQAGKAMKDAKGDLDGKRLPGARENQQKALEQLGEAMDDIDEHMKPSDDRGAGGVGTSGPRQKVEIPDADAYKVPAEFREELLRAMKERAPEKFKQDIERYYEELVK